MAKPLDLTAVDALADWSDWVSFADALDVAPREPGVYMAREGRNGPVVYVGMAGERRGQGLRGRLRVYASGKALTSGLGEAVADRAFADAEWLQCRLDEARLGAPLRAGAWGREAFARADLYVRWATTATKVDALELERRCGALFEALWNRQTFAGR